ncbi:MAG: hypothetical protein WBA28_09200 [Microbacteriaceae bacterium]
MDDLIPEVQFTDFREGELGAILLDGKPIPVTEIGAIPVVPGQEVFHLNLTIVCKIPSMKVVKI